MKKTSLLGLFSVALLLAGCASDSAQRGAVQGAPIVAAPKAAAETQTGPDTKAGTPAHTGASKQSALSEGIDLYDKGDYNGAVKRFIGAPEIWAGDKRTQVTALKYMAFSYCVTGRKTLCRQQFEKALKLDPAFDLAQGEKGHPLWGPVFDRVKKAK